MLMRGRPTARLVSAAKGYGRERCYHEEREERRQKQAGQSQHTAPSSNTPGNPLFHPSFYREVCGQSALPPKPSQHTSRQRECAPIESS